jgi:hypothetical protein
MFEPRWYKKQRRQLQKSIAKAERDIEAESLKLKDVRPQDVGMFGLNVSRYNTRKHDLEMELEVLEAKYLMELGEKWGTDGSPTKLMYDPNYVGLEPRPYFTPQNKELMLKWISDARRKRIREWVEIVSPVASVIISLLAFLLAALALYLQITSMTH